MGRSGFAEKIKRVTDGKGVDVIVDMVGAPYLARNLASLAIEGPLVQHATFPWRRSARRTL